MDYSDPKKYWKLFETKLSFESLLKKWNFYNEETGLEQRFTDLIKNMREIMVFQQTFFKHLELMITEKKKDNKHIIGNVMDMFLRKIRITFKRMNFNQILESQKLFFRFIENTITPWDLSSLLSKNMVFILNDYLREHNELNRDYKNDEIFKCIEEMNVNRDIKNKIIDMV